MTTTESMCWRCGHDNHQHGRLYQLVDADSKIEVCLMCNGWQDYEDPKRGSPARHRFIEFSHD
jgi:hypothetical protein